jgi:hypothetical protein
MERLVTKDAGVGISFLYGKGEDVSSFYYVTPYNRAYITKKTSCWIFYRRIWSDKF